MRVVALVLAAGASSRFGASKLLAPLGDRPVLQHTLDAAASAGLTKVVVVLGADAAAVEAGIEWDGERRVVNPRPGDGLSSSIRVGLDEAALDPTADAVLILPGDQPAVSPGVIRAVIAAGRDSAQPIVRAHYPDDPAPNPVLVRRGAWALVAGLSGDRGLGPLLAQRPDLVLAVDVVGHNPDVDTPADLAAVAVELGL